MKVLAMTGGGTLGHCLPNLAVLPYLKDDFDKIIYIGSEHGPERNAVEGILPYMHICTVKLIRGLDASNLTIPFRLIKGVRQAKNILKENGVTAVFSKGGFVAVPVCLAANALSIPVICHESDRSMGLANRLVEKSCKFILTTFPETARDLKNGIYVGAPIRSELLAERRAEAKKFFGIKGGKPTFLILGGSSGAKAINDFVNEHIDRLLGKYEVLHICGDKHIRGIKKEGYHEVGFLKDMALAYSVADAAASRSGSGAAFELLARGIPTVFIPLTKKASRGDQIENARYFEDRGLSLTLDEDRLDIEVFIKTIERLLTDKERFKDNMKKLDLKGGAKRVADIVVANS